MTTDPSVTFNERRQPLSRAQMLERIQDEFKDLAGMCLTLEQAARLFHLERQLCERLLNTLVARGFLRRIDSGGYARGFDQPAPAASEPSS